MKAKSKLFKILNFANIIPNSPAAGKYHSPISVPSVL